MVETPVSHDQEVRALADGRSQFKATVVGSHQLRWWLRGFGSALELIKPRRLLEE